MPGLLGKKLGMTNIYTEDGVNLPVTVLEVGPCTVVAIKTVEKDGYDALQLGYGGRKEKHTTKPLAGSFKAAGVEPKRVLKEFKCFDVNDFKVGDEITVDTFAEGDFVKVTGTSKGKGFQGVMRRHNFGGVNDATHGQKDRLRHPGSIGQSSYPSRVLKGTRMAGRMGCDKITIKNVDVVRIIPEKNIILVKGPVPGSINALVEINK